MIGRRSPGFVPDNYSVVLELEGPKEAQCGSDICTSIKVRTDLGSMSGFPNKEASKEELHQGRPTERSQTSDIASAPLLITLDWMTLQ